MTNAQYLVFMKATYRDPVTKWRQRGVPSYKEQHPVVDVSWFDAVAFCRWANVRLPTEAEWEKAARGTDGRIYPWGDHPPHLTLCNYGYNAGGTQPVDAYPKGASPYGVMDMAGNAWEWTSSLYRQYPYDANDGREEPESDADRALRGGSWSDDMRFVRCAFRQKLEPYYGYSSHGFRVVFLGP